MSVICLTLLHLHATVNVVMAEHTDIPNEQRPEREWHHYDPPPDYERLTGSERLRELCKLKFAVYAQEVSALPDGALRLTLWRVPEGRPANGYDREFILESRDNTATISLAMHTPRPAPDDPAYVSHTVLGDANSHKNLEDDQAEQIADALEVATALPGLPMSERELAELPARWSAHAAGQLVRVVSVRE